MSSGAAPGLGAAINIIERIISGRADGFWLARCGCGGGGGCGGRLWRPAVTLPGESLAGAKRHKARKLLPLGLAEGREGARRPSFQSASLGAGRKLAQARPSFSHHSRRLGERAIWLWIFELIRIRGASKGARPSELQLGRVVHLGARSPIAHHKRRPHCLQEGGASLTHLAGPRPFRSHFFCIDGAHLDGRAGRR